MSLVDPDRALVVHRPSIVFVYGGPLREKPGDTPLSMRDYFVAWSHESGHDVSELLHLPDDYPEWNQFDGYDNLVDFERDAGYISRAILLFVESPGAFAELGAFCSDSILAERLFVVLYSRYFKANSFIALGPLRILERLHGEDQAICPVDGDKLEDFEKVVDDVANEVFAKSKRIPQQTAFDPENVRDQFLLIADLIELFGALKLIEITVFLKFFKVSVSNKRVTQMLNLLCLIKVIQRSDHLNRHFYVPPKNAREPFIAYKVLEADGRFNRIKIKLTATEKMKQDSFRRQAYEKVHGRH